MTSGAGGGGWRQRWCWHELPGDELAIYGVEVHQGDAPVDRDSDFGNDDNAWHEMLSLKDNLDPPVLNSLSNEHDLLFDH